jgi:hypothetical protein
LRGDNSKAESIKRIAIGCITRFQLENNKKEKPGSSGFPASAAFGSGRKTTSTLKPTA